MERPMSEQDSAATAAKKHQEAQRQLVIDYKAVFGSDKGQRVLSDLKKVFGFDRWEAQDSEDANVIARRVCMKGPIFHIERMLKTTFAREQKPKRAITTHEKPDQPPPG